MIIVVLMGYHTGTCVLFMRHIGHTAQAPFSTNNPCPISKKLHFQTQTQTHKQIISNTDTDVDTHVLTNTHKHTHTYT